MSNLLSSLSRTVHASLGVSIILFLGLFFLNDGFAFDTLFWSWLFRFVHVIVAIMWIGLLWYFNFVQIPSMPKIPDEQKPAIGKVIAPEALFWFRWGALATWITGAGALEAMGIGLMNAFTLQSGAAVIGFGAWLGTIMLFNVWVLIWPNQKKALGIVQVEADEKAKAGRTAMLFSRTNTMLSIPMLYAMVAAQNLF